MIKKLITITAFLAMAMTFCLVGGVNAAGDEVLFSADTNMNILDKNTGSGSDLVVKSGSKVTTIAADTDSVTVTLGADSDIIFESAGGSIISVNCASGSTFVPGVPSRMNIVDHDDCHTVVATIGAGALIEVDVAANPLTAATASAYTVTFRTVNALTAGQKIKLVFGSGFTIDESVLEATVTNFTDDGDSVGTGTLAGGDFVFTGDLVSTTATKTITLAIPTGTTIAASSVINIVLDSTLVTNPAVASATVGISGVDIYTTTSDGTTIDSKTASPTAFNRVIDLEPGWNIFAPSQKLQTPDAIGTTTSVLTPITGDYSTVYTLTRADAGVMTWTTPDTIDPLYGYAIYITAGSTVKLPLDFAKETASNGVYSRSLAQKGWHIVGYVGDDDGSNDYLSAQDEVLIDLKVGGNEEFSQIVDFTGTGNPWTTAPSDHKFAATMTTEYANATENMRFHIDFGYAIVTTADDLLLNGNRDE